MHFALSVNGAPAVNVLVTEAQAATTPRSRISSTT
jgi:hypothetical protein